MMLQCTGCICSLSLSEGITNKLCSKILKEQDEIWFVDRFTSIGMPFGGL